VIAREVVRLIQHDKQLTMGKTILVEFPKNQPFLAEVEQEGLRQVFINLARNALEAMQLGGILRITGENPGRGRIFVVFRDTGVGIAPHELEHVFKPFHTSKKGGTGLGLAIANRIVESSGGAVRIKSTPGMGTAVTVELKAARETSPSSHTEQLPTSSEGTRSVEATS
jgi:two-component system, sporulation sensor kinase E